MKTAITGDPKRTILLVHGLGANRLLMALMARRLSARGFRVLNWGYSSIRYTIERHAEAMRRTLRQLDEDPAVAEIHIVAHSMGGIVARTALMKERPSKLRRMVMMAPPNHGSYWASWFGPWLRPLCHTLDQLAARPDSYVNTLPLPEDLELGIIACERDLLVHRESTRLDVQHDYFVSESKHHSGVLFRDDVAEQIAHFLSDGRFRHPEPHSHPQAQAEPAPAFITATAMSTPGMIAK